MQTDHLEQGARNSGLDLGMVYYVLFRHKWKVAIALALGLAGAIAAVAIIRVQYRSEASILVRYVLDTKEPATTDAQIKMPDSRGDNIINSEIQILSSYNVIDAAVVKVEPARILAKVSGGSNPQAAARYLADRLEVRVPARSDVIRVSLRHPDGQIAREALDEIVKKFKDEHHRVHGVAITDDVLTDRTEALRKELKGYEDALRDKKGDQIVSFADARTMLNEEIVDIRKSLSKAEAELVTKEVVYELMQGISGISSDTNKVTTPIDRERADEYNELLRDLSQARQRYHDVSSKYTEESSYVRNAKARIDELRDKKKALEAEHPQLATLTLGTATNDKSPMNPVETFAQIKELSALKKYYDGQLSNAVVRLDRLEKNAPDIKELERKRDWVESNYKWYSTKKEQATLEETLGNYSNLQVVQDASHAVLDFSAMKKPLAIILAGGLLLGVGMALLCEFVLDQSVRHPIELRTHFNLPVLATIPDVNGRKPRSKRGSLRLPGQINGQTTDNHLPVETNGEAARLSSYFGALRDRTVMYLERMTHKPKLVAVTGSDARSGVTTIATGLAKALSETAEGRVLLVDMTSESGTSHPYLNGKPSCALSEMLDQDKAASVHENLFVATVVERTEGPLPIVPKRFASLIPKLKASDYDYVVFDMPPVTQTSITPRLAALMDIVLLVVESERSQRNSVRRATESLVEAKANVRSVLNKHRTYIPQWLYQEE